MLNKTNRTLHIMILPGMLFLFVFSILPMFGILIAFERYLPARGIFGSRWIGLDNFKFMFRLTESRTIFFNTIIIAVSKLILNLIIPLLFALILNAMRSASFKRAIQTVVYLPNFISWVIMSGMIINIFSLDGMLNKLLGQFGGDSILFMASNTWFRPIVVLSDVWKTFGYNSIIFLAALTGIDQALYEASAIDGATKFQQLISITLPGIIGSVVLVGTLSLGNVLNAGFDQIFNLYNPLVYQTGDIIDTWVYRAGLENAQYGLATAVGLLKSGISFVLIILSYKLADRFANYRIF